jgi:hypothetical protein
MLGWRDKMGWTEEYEAELWRGTDVEVYQEKLLPCEKVRESYMNGRGHWLVFHCSIVFMRRLQTMFVVADMTFSTGIWHRCGLFPNTRVGESLRCSFATLLNSPTE